MSRLVNASYDMHRVIALYLSVRDRVHLSVTCRDLLRVRDLRFEHDVICINQHTVRRLVHAVPPQNEWHAQVRGYKRLVIDLGHKVSSELPSLILPDRFALVHCCNTMGYFAFRDVTALAFRNGADFAFVEAPITACDIDLYGNCIPCETPKCEMLTFVCLFTSLRELCFESVTDATLVYFLLSRNAHSLHILSCGRTVQWEQVRQLSLVRCKLEQLRELYAPGITLSRNDDEFVLPRKLSILHVQDVIQPSTIRPALQYVHLACHCIDNAASALSLMQITYPNATVHKYHFKSDDDDDDDDDDKENQLACDTEEQMKTLCALSATRRIENTHGWIKSISC